ncbi:MAG: hypothetical protein HC895_16050 [Leptolyngbyaceae cyanobacterium SM1_3_5]|nr:hypothetical protein [Leptolyngbyaceae cyanobacterium SM1_3_5]
MKKLFPHPQDYLGGCNPRFTERNDDRGTTPPALADFRLGYLYQSPIDRPQVCLTYSDFQWQDQSEAVQWRGNRFEPFAPIVDRTPTLYLGFDRPLPADLISLYLDIQETALGNLLKWEYWDKTWLPLSVEDETRNLALPGMVSAIWAGVTASPTAAVLQASGDRVQLIDARQTAQFAPAICSTSAKKKKANW